MPTSMQRGAGALVCVLAAPLDLARATQQPFVLQQRPLQPAFQAAYMPELAMPQYSPYLVQPMKQAFEPAMGSYMPAAEPTSALQLLQAGEERAQERRQLQEQLAQARHEIEQRERAEKAQQLEQRELKQQLATAQAHLSEEMRARQAIQQENSQLARAQEREQAQLATLRHERNELAEGLTIRDRTDKALHEQLALLQRQRDQMVQLAERAKDEQRDREAVAKNLTERLMLLQQSSADAAHRESEYKVLLMQLTQKLTNERKATEQGQAALKQLTEQEEGSRRALALAQAEAQRAERRLNTSEEANSQLQLLLAKNERRLNESNALIGQRRQEDEHRLQAAVEQAKQLEAKLAEERADRQHELETSRRLLQARDSDKAFLETSSMLLRGGEARLRQASQDLEEARGRAKALEAKASQQEQKLRQENEELKQRLLLSNVEARKLSSEASQLQARSKRLRMMPWAELLGRCRDDVCFTLAHRVACCGGPKDIVAQRPEACDLAARVAAGAAAAPEVCGGVAAAAPTAATAAPAAAAAA